MIVYFLKSILCAALLLLVYHLFLEKEKMHRFNRFYLLGSLLFSFIVPFITIEFSRPAAPVKESIVLLNDNFTSLSQQTTAVIHNSGNWLTLVPAILYIGVALALSFRFVKNSRSLIIKIQKNKRTVYHNAQLVLTNDQEVPHSFLHYIFLDQQQYEAGAIKREILQHELAHVQQKHSLDILLIELIAIITWFNPLVYLYRKAIWLNHEFLADEAVIHTCKNPSHYQLLLIDAVSQSAGLSFASQFNYSITKKRLVMITKHKSFATVLVKQLALLPLLAGILFLFSSKTLAQEPVKPPSVTPRIESAPQPAPQGIIEEYNTILKGYNLDTKEGKKEFSTKITAEDRRQLELLYKKMDAKQQSEQVVGFMKPYGPLKRAVPSVETFDDFKDGAKYGVWINDKKVSNDALNNYKASDFSQYNVSKLYGAAKKNVSYFYQVNMMTNTYYQKYYDKSMANKDKSMMYILRAPNRIMIVGPY